MQKFSKKEAFKFGWETFKKNPGLLIGILLTTWIISYAPGINRNISYDLNNINTFIFSLMIELILLVIQTSVSLGVVRVCLKLVNGQKAIYSDITYANIKGILSSFVASIIYIFAIGVGVLALLIPGIYIAIKYQFYNYAIVEKGLGPIEALKESGRITKGNHWNLLMFGLLSMAISIGGLLLLVIGVFIAIPVTMVAQAYVYRKLLNQTITTPSQTQPIQQY